MQQGHAVLVQHFRHLAQVGAVVVDADMLEHADRNDPVEALIDIPVILQAELDLSFEPALRHPCPGGRRLLVGERDAGDVLGAGDFRQI